MALLIVLWTLLLVGVVGASLNSQARKQGLLARNGVASARAEAAAEGGIIRAIAAMSDPRPELVWRADGSIHHLALDGLKIEIRIIDEAGKVDLNAAPPELIASVLQVVGAKPGTAISIASAVADLRRGVFTGKPRGFETTSEILGVPGMTPDLYERAAPFMTTLTHTASIDVNVAPRELLAALSELGSSAGGSGVSNAGGLPTAAPQHSVFAVEAVVWDGRTRFGRQAIIRLTHNAEIPYLVHLWAPLASRHGLQTSQK